MRPMLALGLLFGPGKGLFITSPTLLLGLGGLILMGKRRPFLSSGLAAALLACRSLPSLGWFPDGSVSWVSGYHGHFVGLLVCPTMLAIHAFWRGQAGRVLVIGIIALALGI